jgi:hypothetical protein
MSDEIQRNLPGNPEWESSFYGKLAEHGVWDVDAFWRLHLDLILAARTNCLSEQIDRKFALVVTTLFARVANLIEAHFNSNDVFKITNMTTDDLLAFRERFEHAVLGVFSGEILPETSFDLTNPLIKI